MESGDWILEVVQDNTKVKEKGFVNESSVCDNIIACMHMPTCFKYKHTDSESLRV